MRSDLKLLTVLLILLLVGLLSWLVRWIWKTVRQKFDQDVELYKLKLDNMHMAATIRERGAVKDELYEASMKAGRGEGYMQVVEYIVMLASQGSEGKYDEIREAMQKEMGQFKSQMERELGNGKTMKRELENLRVLRGDMQNELKQMRLMSRSISRERSREFTHTRGVDNASETRQNPVDKPSESRQKAVAKPSETGNQRVSDAETRDLYPIFKLQDSDSRYKLQASEDLSRIHLINKRSGEEMEVVPVGHLRKGKPYKVAQAVYLIWCELPGCNKLKITQSSNARACSREHMNELTLLDRQKMKHGS